MSKKSDVEHQPAAVDTEKPLMPQDYAPNISINLNPERHPIELGFWALCGVTVQLTALVIPGLTVYHWKLKKGDDTVEDYAYPLVVVGTTLLVIGMYICASVVEMASKEKTWAKGPNFPAQALGARILWLQRQHVVSDQNFDAFAVVARGKRSAIITSHPSQRNRHADEKDLGIQKSFFGYFANSWFEAAAVGGSFVSICGFIVQFTGLRSMHWSASVIQLGATLIMTIVRAVVRRGLVERPHAEAIHHQHEMDWLAVTMTADPDAFWEQVDHVQPGESEPRGDGEQRRTWVVVTGRGISEYKGVWAQETSLGNEAQNVVQVRQRLGQLRQWKGPASEMAASVAFAIEVVMNTLFSPSRFQTFTWKLNVRCGGSNSESVQQVRLRARKSENNVWEADATWIDAVLSLWIYHVRQAESSRRLSGSGKRSKPDWMRHGDGALRKPNIRLLGPDTAMTHRCLDWYVGLSTAQIVAVTQILDKDESLGNRDTILEFDEGLIMGWDHLATETQPSAAAVDTVRRFKRLPDSRERDHSDGSLAVVTDSHLEDIFARDVFSTFMWAAANEGQPIGGETRLAVLNAEGGTLLPRSENFQLENTELKKIANGLERSGIASTIEAYTYIVPPFAHRGKMPDPYEVVEHIEETAKSYLPMNRWREVTELYVWLFKVCKDYPPTGPANIRATILLVDLFRELINLSNMWEAQQPGVTDRWKLKDLRDEVRENLNTAKTQIVCVVHELFATDQLEGWDSPEFDQWRSDDKTPKRKYLRLRSSKFWKNPAGAAFHTAAMDDDVDLQGMSGERFRKKLENKDIFDRRALHYSAMSKDEVMTELLNSGAIPKVIDIFGWTPLHYASWFGDTAKVSLLLQSGAIVKHQGVDGLTALHCAAKRGHKECLEHLLALSRNPDLLDNQRRTPLHHAAFAGFSEITEYLLQKDASRSARDFEGATPLHLAVAGGDQRTVFHLIDHKYRNLQLPDVLLCDRNGRSAISWAAGTGTLVSLKGEFVMLEHMRRFYMNSPSADLFITPYTQLDRTHRTPLSWAAGNGYLPAVRYLLGDKNVPQVCDHRGRSPLSWAAANGHAEVVNTMVTEFKSKVEERDLHGRTPLSYAAEANHTETVRLLVSSLGANPNVGENLTGLTPLHRAAAKGHTETVLELLDSTANIESVTKDIRTPLHEAVKSGNIETVRLLLERGADIHREYEGSTALHLAAVYGYARILELLAASGANIHGVNQQGRTPLQRACRERRSAVVGKLLNLGADPEYRDPQGFSAVHLAALAGNFGVMQALLDRKPDLEAKDNLGRTPMFLAAMNRHRSVVALLKRAGAKPQVLNKDEKAPDCSLESAINSRMATSSTLGGQSFA